MCFSALVFSRWPTAYTRACVYTYINIYIYIYVLSWLNSRSAGTNYNEPRLVGRESAMFSFLCPVVYRPFYRGHPPPSLVSPPSRPISCHIPRHLPRPLLYPLPLPNPKRRYLRRDCPPHFLFHGICLQCEIRLRGEKKKFQLFETGTKEAARKSGRDTRQRIACVAKCYIARDDL